MIPPSGGLSLYHQGSRPTPAASLEFNKHFCSKLRNKRATEASRGAAQMRCYNGKLSKFLSASSSVGTQHISITLFGMLWKVSHVYSGTQRSSISSWDHIMRHEGRKQHSSSSTSFDGVTAPKATNRSPWAPRLEPVARPPMGQW